MKRKVIIISLCLLLLPTWAWSACTGSNPYTCSSIADLNTQIAAAVKGDTIILSDGSYAGSMVGDVSGLTGGANEPTESEPIIVKAETPGGVIMTGGSSIQLTGKYIYFHGFDFTTCSNSYGTIRFWGAYRTRLTNCRFTCTNGGPNSTFIFSKGYPGPDWVAYDSSTHNRFDHNEVTGSFDNSIITIRTDGDPNPDRFDIANTNNTIDHNYLHDIPDNCGNCDTVQTGRGSAYYATEFAADQYSTIEHNYFNQVHIGNELISSKSSSNTVRFNVIKFTIATKDTQTTFRGGDDGVFEGNIVIATGGKDTGGACVRLFGKNHVIKNNYCENMYAPIILRWGDSAGEPDVDNIQILNNTIVENYNGAVRAYKRYASSVNQPTNVTIKNNLQNGKTWTKYAYEDPTASTTTWTTNTYYLEAGGGVGVSDPGVVSSDPNLTDDGDVWRLQASSTNMINAGTTDANVTNDFDGQARAGNPDIGADEYDASSHIRDYASIVAGAGTVWPAETDMSEFYPAAGADTTPPTLSGPLPSTEQTCTSDPRNVTIQVTATDATDVTACKYCEDGVGGCTSGTDIDSMTGTLTEGGSDVWSDTVSNACGASLTYYAKCEDAADNESGATTISYTVGISMPIVRNIDLMGGVIIQ